MYLNFPYDTRVKCGAQMEEKGTEQRDRQQGSLPAVEDPQGTLLPAGVMGNLKHQEAGMETLFGGRKGRSLHK